MVNITQMQKDAIILVKNRYEFDNNGGELALEVQTNVALEIVNMNTVNNLTIISFNRTFVELKLKESNSRNFKK